MPMYYPDLKSVQQCAQQMAEQPDPTKKYKGLIPTTEKELPQARIELGQYFRRVWNDVVAALEVEEAATEENYHEVLARGLRR